jgi:glycosyl hydrolase family 12
MTVPGRLRAAGAAMCVAACLVAACSAERVTAIEPGGADDAGGSGGDEASVDTGSREASVGSDSGSSGSSSSGDGSGSESGVSPPACAQAAAAFTTSDAEGQWSDGGYFIRNDAWNSDAGPQTLYACSYRSWNVVANEPSTTDVKAYPDVQMDFQENGASDGTGKPIGAFHSITSTFAETSPHVGIYEDAYDIFVNSSTLVGPGTTEIMIWVDNYNQAPAGSKVATAVPLDSRAYDVYYLADNGNGGHYVAFVANTNFTSGSVDILSFFNYAIQQGWIPATAPLNQICFGVEICETNGGSATFEFTDFSISAN